MAKFTDTITIRVKAGHGGAGSVSFRREKFVPKGGPDGGDGGRGGNVVLVADRRYYNLSHLFPERIYTAESGKPGSSNNMFGKDGSDLVICVPPGTEVIDSETQELLTDLTEEEIPYIVATGGIGGRGNTHFKSSTNQAPRYAQPGIPGEERHISFNLKLIADLGLVGLPNAGKSTLLAALTNAKPKIGSYPFTTLVPNLGIVERDRFSYKIADIPGIIEGAHRGLGLGLSFLQHIERVKVILYLVDATGEDLLYNYQLLKSEMKSYNESLVDKESIVVLTKADLVDESSVEEKSKLFKERVIPISALTGKNMEMLSTSLDALMEIKNAP